MFALFVCRELFGIELDVRIYEVVFHEIVLPIDRIVNGVSQELGKQPIQLVFRLEDGPLPRRSGGLTSGSSEQQLELHVESNDVTHAGVPEL